MKLTRMLAPLAAFAFTLGAQANDYAKDSFEVESWSNSTGGYSYEGDSEAVDETALYTYDNDGPAVTPSPIGSNPNAKGLKLSTDTGTLFRDLTNATIGASGLYVDTLVQFTPTDVSERPDCSANDKFVIWLEVNNNETNLCVWASEYGIDNDAVVRGTNKVYVLDTPASVKVPGSWHRLTVKALKQTYTEDVKMPGFQVYIDNNDVPLQSGEYFSPTDQSQAMSDKLFADGASDLLDMFNARTFFPAANVTALGQLQKVGFSGEGYIDEFVVSDAIPSALPHVDVTVAWDDTIIASAAFVGNGGTTSLSGNGGTFTMPTNSTVTLTKSNLAAASDVDLSNYAFAAADNAAWNLSGNVNISVDGDTVTITSAGNGAGSFTIALVANNAAVLTVMAPMEGTDWFYEYVTNISYSINGGASVELPEFDWTGEALVNLEKNQTITFTYSLKDGGSGSLRFTPIDGVTGSGLSFTVTGNTAEIDLEVFLPKATVNGVEYDSFADAVTAAIGTEYPVVLCADIELEEALEIAANEELTIDLNGYTITGAAAEAVFENAGTLTITDTSALAEGAVVAGSDGYVVVNAGALFLEYGSYAGAFTNSGTFEISTDCLFDNNLSGVYTPAAGYAVEETGVETGLYQLTLLTYTITYMNGEDEITELSPATYTVEDIVELPTPTLLGVTFNGWKDGEDNDVEDWNAGDRTGNLVLYADVTPIVVIPEYTISYYDADGETVFTSWAQGYTAPASYSNEVVTLPVAANVDLGGLVGVEFGGWTNAAGQAVLDTTGLAADLVVYAKLDPVVAPVQEYTISYLNEDGTTFTSWADGYTAPASYSNEVVTLPVAANVDLGAVGVAFDGWTNAVGTVIATTEGYTENLTVYAKLRATGTTPVNPGETTGSYETQADAEAAAESVTIAPTTAVEDALEAAGVDAATYTAMFEGKAVDNGDGTYSVEVVLTPAATNALQTAAEAAVESAAVAAALPGVAQDDVQAAVPATPGFYYSIAAGASLDSLTEGARTLAQGSTVTLTLPQQSGNTGFYKVLINISPKTNP